MLFGYASVFNSMSEDMGFFEKVRPGAFARCIRENQDVRALINHNESMVLGRTAAKTLRLKEDDTGLACEIDMPDTSYARDLAVSIKRGDVNQMSFSFRCIKEDWAFPGGQSVRDLIDLDLYDVSPVTFPAYTDTVVGLRNLERWKKTMIVIPPDVMRRARLVLAKAKIKS